MEKQINSPSKQKNQKIYFSYKVQDINSIYEPSDESNQNDPEKKNNEKISQEQQKLKNLEMQSQKQSSSSQNYMIKTQGLGLTDFKFIIKKRKGQQLNKNELTTSKNIKEKQDHITDQIKFRKKINKQIQNNSLIFQKQHFNTPEKIKNIDVNNTVLSTNQKTFGFHHNNQIIQSHKLRAEFLSDAKKSKKGLANISFKVKKIVLEHKKLTYKQVSDLVLIESKQVLQSLNQKEKQKETKNIRRRVYDALNVLIAVEVLGKVNRNVVLTQWTNHQGKKLTSQWSSFRSMQQQISNKIGSCEEKQTKLNELIGKYSSILKFRKRNQINEIDEKRMKIQIPLKVYFPILFIPRYKTPIQIEIQRQYKLETVAIRSKGLTILSDIDAITKLNINIIINQNEIEDILNKIKNKNLQKIQEQ